MELKDSSDRLVGMFGIILCLLCLSYFYAIDRTWLSSAGFSPIFQTLLLVYDVQTAWLSVFICIVAVFWIKPDPVLRVVDWLGANPFAVSFSCIVACSAGAILVYKNYPLCMDEYAAVFQSEVFAAGQLSAHLPASAIDWLVVPGFNGSFFVASRTNGLAIEGYWPGFALLLTPFQWVGVPWLCNALLAGTSVFLAYQITLRLTNDRRAAAWTILFTVASSVFWANAISYYSMQAHLTANLLFAWLLLAPNRNRALAAGLVGSLALVLHNPFPHALFAAPWLAAMVMDRLTRRYAVPLLLGYAPGLAIVIGWLVLRSDISQVAEGTSTVRTIVSGIFMSPDAGLLDMRVASLAKMWVWAVPCLFVFAGIGLLRHRGDRRVRLLAQSIAVTFAAYLFVKLDQGHGWGYRYFHSAWGAIPILAGCAMTGDSQAKSRLASFAGASAILSLLVLVPFQMMQIRGIIARHMALIPAPARPGNNVYFIQPGGGLYIADAIQIDPLLRSQDLLLASRGSKLDAELIRQNWPGAVKTRGGPWVEQWHLGPLDQRVSASDWRHERHFEIHYRPHIESSDSTNPNP